MIPRNRLSPKNCDNLQNLDSSRTRELAAIQSAIRCNMRELSALIHDGNDRQIARAAGELGAAVESMETATQKILASAEAVDDCARALASVLDDDYHHGLACRITWSPSTRRAISRISRARASAR